MSISISNLTVANNARSGTIIGTLTAIDPSGAVIPRTYTLTKGSIGYFAITTNNLVITWATPATPGHYSVRIRAIGTSGRFSGSATFMVNIATPLLPPPPPPPPPIISSNPPNPAIPAMTPKGAVVAGIVVAMSDGSPFTGTLGFGPPNYDPGGAFAISGSQLIINPSGAGVGSDGGTIQNCTVVINL